MMDRHALRQWRVSGSLAELLNDSSWGGNGPADLPPGTGQAGIGTIRTGIVARNGTGWWKAAVGGQRGQDEARVNLMFR
jgi:hypothetical protein